MTSRTFYLVGITAATLFAHVLPVPGARAYAAHDEAGATKQAESKRALNAKTAEKKPGTVKSDEATGKEAKSERATEPRSRSGFVPPPPPETPSLLSAPEGAAGDGMYIQQFVPIEFLSPFTLKERQKQLAAQLQAAQTELKTRQEETGAKTDRSKQFSALFDEGVISRRELELSKEDAKRSQGELDNAKAKVADLQLALARVSERLKSLSKVGFNSSKQKSPSRKTGRRAKDQAKTHAATEGAVAKDQAKTHAATEGAVAKNQAKTHAATEGAVAKNQAKTHAATEGAVAKNQAKTHAVTEGAVAKDQPKTHAATEGAVAKNQAKTHAVTEGAVAKDQAKTHAAIEGAVAKDQAKTH